MYVLHFWPILWDTLHVLQWLQTSFYSVFTNVSLFTKWTLQIPPVTLSPSILSHLTLEIISMIFWNMHLQVFRHHFLYSWRFQSNCFYIRFQPKCLFEDQIRTDWLLRAVRTTRLQLELQLWVNSNGTYNVHCITITVSTFIFNIHNVYYVVVEALSVGVNPLQKSMKRIDY